MLRTAVGIGAQRAMPPLNISFTRPRRRTGNVGSVLTNQPLKYLTLLAFTIKFTTSKFWIALLCALYFTLVYSSTTCNFLFHSSLSWFPDSKQVFLLTDYREREARSTNKKQILKSCVPHQDKSMYLALTTLTS